jgi:hypothetical protein
MASPAAPRPGRGQPAAVIPQSSAKLPTFAGQHIRKSVPSSQWQGLLRTENWELRTKKGTSCLIQNDDIHKSAPPPGAHTTRCPSTRCLSVQTAMSGRCHTARARNAEPTRAAKS